jgi:hypothetical protein
VFQPELGVVDGIGGKLAVAVAVAVAVVVMAVASVPLLGWNLGPVAGAVTALIANMKTWTTGSTINGSRTEMITNAKR